MPTTRRRPLAIALAAACVLTACARAPGGGDGGGAEDRAAIDLVALFPHTASAQERGRIDLGTPAGDLLMLEGWSPGGRLADGGTAAEAIERRAALRFAIAEPAARRLRLRVAAIAPVEPTAPRARERRQTILVSLNDQRVGTLRIAADPAEHALDLPVRAQRSGENVLRFEHPALAPAGGRRPPGWAPPRIAYDWVEIARGDGSIAQVPYRASDATLALPAGSRTAFHLRAAAAHELRFTLAPEPGAEAVARVRVSLRADGGAESGTSGSARQVHAAEARPGESVAVALRLDAGTAGRDEMIALEIASDGPAAAVLERPEVLGPRVGAPAAAAAPAATAAEANAGGAAALAAAAPSGGDAGASAARPPSILLYVIDTLRADHLGCYGYGRDTSPRIDALARDGVLFTQAIAHAPWTRPSVASLLTGLLPQAHGADSLRRTIRPGIASLAEVLAAAGYDTAAFVTNVNVSAGLGFDRGFATFRYLPEDEARASRHVLSDELNREVIAWLERPRERPFFLYVHASDPHAPYTPPADLAARFGAPLRPAATPSPADDGGGARALDAAWLASVVAAYDAEIAANDRSFGALVDALGALGLDRDTAIVLTSDHGEELGDHGGLDHGHTLYDELIRVPLVVRAPTAGGRAAAFGAPGTRRDTLVRHVDLMPSLIEIAGAAPPAGLAGASLLDPRDDAVAGDAREAVSHTRFGPHDLAAVRSPGWKVVRSGSAHRRAEPVEIYDLGADPGESRNLARARPALAGYAHQELSRAAAMRPRLGTGELAGDAPAIDAETERRLRALGYAD